MLRLSLKPIRKKECEDIVYSLLFMISIIFLVYIHNTAYKVIVIVTCGMGILKAIVHSRKLHVNSMIVYWAFFAAWCFLSSLWAYYMVPGSKLIVIVFSIYSFFFLCNYLTTENRFLWMLKAYMFSAIVLAVYLFFYYGISSIIASKRLPSEIVNSNAVGSILASAMLLALFFWKKEKNRWYFGLWMLLGSGVLISGSKSAFLNAAVSGIIFFSAYYRKRMRLRHFIVTLVIAGVVGVLILKVDFFYDIIGRRLVGLWNNLLGRESVRSLGRYHSTYIRSYLYRESWAAFLRHPLCGVGLDNFRYINFYGMYAHSNILELLASLGIVGTGFFYGAYFACFRRYEKVKRYMRDEERAAIKGLMAGFIVVNFFGVLYHNLNEHVLIFIFYCAMGMQMWNRGRLEGLGEREA